MRNTTLYLVFFLLAAVSFTLATALQTRASGWSQRGQDSVIKVLLGDGRRLFANHFLVKADIYFHSGYYPSIFDQGSAAPKESHLTEHHEEHHDEEHEKEADFLGAPRDYLERFGRHFMITEHSHLEHGQEREILPWLRLSADLDPQRVETYTLASYWLRSRLGKVKEAEEFLREGLRANPDSYEILFELGQLYYQNHHDSERARNVWELALRRWREQEPGKAQPNKFAFQEITVNLARLEEGQGNWARAITFLELAKAVSPAPDALQKQIDELKKKVSTKESSPSTH